MPERYPLSKCYELLDIDPKTFRKWIEKAGWQSLLKQQKSKADDRVKYLTEEQLKNLAEMHERVLALPEQKPTLPASSYNLLIDQIDEARTEAANAFSQVHEAYRTIDAVRESYEKELTALRVLLEEQDNRQENRVNELSHAIEQFQQETTASIGTVITASENHRQQLKGHASLISELQNQVQQLEVELHRQIEQRQTQLDLISSRIEPRLNSLTDLTDSLSSTQLSLQHQVNALTTEAKLQQALQVQVNQLAAALATETEQRQRLQDQTSQLATALTIEQEQRQALANQVAQLAEASQCTQSSEKKPIRRRRSSPPSINKSIE